MERRQAILEYLCQKRFETTRNLAAMFNVCERTIRNDIVMLSCKYPIETSFGPYGGIQIANWFHLDRIILSGEQIALLKKVRSSLNEKDAQIMDSIFVRLSINA